MHKDFHWLHPKRWSGSAVTMLALIGILVLVPLATFAEPIFTAPPVAPRSAPPSAPPAQEQGAEATLTIIEIGCKKKADLAIILFAAREDGIPEDEILRRVEGTIKKQIEAGATLSYADEIDFYRMTRDIYRKDPSGDYKIPLEYIENFAWTEFRSCTMTYQGCSLIISEGIDESSGGLTECEDWQ